MEKDKIFNSIFGFDNSPILLAVWKNIEGFLLNWKLDNGQKSNRAGHSRVQAFPGFTHSEEFCLFPCLLFFRMRLESVKRTGR